MVCVCVRDVIDVVFSVCIVRHGAVCVRVWEVYVYNVMPMLYGCVFYTSCVSACIMFWVQVLYN